MAIDASPIEGPIQTPLEIEPSHSFQTLIGQLDVQLRIHDVPMTAFEMFDERHMLEGRLSRYVPDTFVVNVTGMSIEVNGNVFGFGVSPIDAAAYANLVYNTDGSIKEIEFVLVPFYEVGTKPKKPVHISYNPRYMQFKGMNVEPSHAQVILDAFTSDDLSDHIVKVVEHFFPHERGHLHSFERAS